MSVIDSVKNTFETVKGTAGEAYQMHRYNQMKKTYGEDIALGILKPRLEEMGLSTDDFRTYCKVKTAIQSGDLDIEAAEREADHAAKAVIHSMLPA